MTIDTRLPCDPETRLPVFARNRSANELWAALLEKAYAKLHGNYASLNGGSVAEALVDLRWGGVGAWVRAHGSTHGHDRHWWRAVTHSLTRSLIHSIFARSLTRSLPFGSPTHPRLTRSKDCTRAYLFLHSSDLHSGGASQKLILKDVAHKLGSSGLWDKLRRYLKFNYLMGASYSDKDAAMEEERAKVGGFAGRLFGWLIRSLLPAFAPAFFSFFLSCCSFIHSFVFIHSFTHSLTHSLIHSLTHSLTHAFTHSCLP